MACRRMNKSWRVLNKARPVPNEAHPVLNKARLRMNKSCPRMNMAYPRMILACLRMKMACRRTILACRGANKIRSYLHILYFQALAENGLSAGPCSPSPAAGPTRALKGFQKNPVGDSTRPASEDRRRGARRPPRPAPASRGKEPPFAPPSRPWRPPREPVETPSTLYPSRSIPKRPPQPCGERGQDVALHPDMGGSIKTS